MIVKCLGSTGSCLSSKYHSTGLSSDKTRFNLTVGKSYTVYAIEENGGLAYFYICDDDYTYYPRSLPADLFVVVDSKSYPKWIIKNTGQGQNVTASKEWFADTMFYENLVDMDEHAVRTFDSIKRSIDEWLRLESTS